MDRLKKLMPVLTVLGAIVALLTGVGFLRTPQQAARCVAVVRKPVEEVWPTAGAVEEWSSWASSFEGLRRTGLQAGQETFVLGGLLGERTFRIEKRKEPYELVLAVEGPLLSGRWVLVLDHVPAGTQVTLTEYGEVTNPFQRGVHLFVDTHGELGSVLEDLCAHLEVRPFVEEHDVSESEVTKALAAPSPGAGD